MKLIHLSDLHLGKRVNEFSMLEDQEYILIKIINIIDEEQPDAILIAGDVYDRSVPSEEAMQLWDDFLGKIAKRNIPAYAISGNHDSAVRFSVHEKFVDAAGIHLSQAYKGKVKSYAQNDEYGTVNFYLLPFIKPVNVKAYHQDAEIGDYSDAVRKAIEHMDVDSSERNVIIAHQFVTGASRCESEEVVVGGIDNVDASVFDMFDYVALGHIHGGQHIGRESIRYCGTPLKYSFSEKNHVKSVTVVELKEKGNCEIRTVPLIPLHDMREIRGTYNELTLKDNYVGTATDDYIQIILTDEEEIPDAINKLRLIYPNIMKLIYDNKRTSSRQEIRDVQDIEDKTPVMLLNELYEKQNNQPMNEQQRELANNLISRIWGRNHETT